MGVNKVILLGRVGQNPELKYTSNQYAICNFSVATSERRKENGEYKDHVEWHKVVTFGKVAEACSKYLTKGSELYIEGKIQTRKWDDKDGQKRSATEIVAGSVQFIGKKSDGTGSTNEANDAPDNKALPSIDISQQQIAFDDDDIPF